MDILEISGITSKHKKEVFRTLKNYSKYILFRVDKSKSLNYFKKLKESYSVAYYKKQIYQIRKFLAYLKINWYIEIKLPRDTEIIPKRITYMDISQTIEYFRDKDGFKRHRAIILLGYTSGLRAEEPGDRCGLTRRSKDRNSYSLMYYLTWNEGKRWERCLNCKHFDW